MKFNIGDIIKGNKEADFRYYVTNSYCTGRVVKAYENGKVLLKIISHKHYREEVGNEYTVDECCFDLVTSNSWTGLYGAANLRQLFAIENGVPVVNNVGKDSPCYRQLCEEYKEFLKKEKEKKRT